MQSDLLSEPNYFCYSCNKVFHTKLQNNIQCTQCGSDFIEEQETISQHQQQQQSQQQESSPQISQNFFRRVTTIRQNGQIQIQVEESKEPFSNEMFFHPFVRRQMLPFNFFGDMQIMNFDQRLAELLSLQQAQPNVNRKVSEQVINNLEEIQPDGSQDCAICKETMHKSEMKVKKLPCGHHFHGECILPWLRQNNTCPVCRYSLPVEE